MGDSSRRPRSRRAVAWALLAVAVGASAAAPWCIRQGRYWYQMRQARLALAKGFPDNAVLALAPALRLRPDAAEAHFLMGVAHRRGGHLDEVREPLERAEKLGWSRRAVKRQRVLLAMQAGDRDAEMELRESLKYPMTDEVAEETCEALALGYLSEYRLTDAQTCLDYWIAWQPDCVRARLLRAELPWMSGDRQMQVDEYQRILQIDPENYTAHLALAQLYLAQHTIEEALQEFRWCRNVWPADPICRLGLANCLQHQGKLDEAMQIYDELSGLEAPPSQRAFLLSEIGQVHLNSGQYEKAAEALAESVKLHAYDSVSQYSLGSALSKLGRKQEAKIYLDRAKELQRHRGLLGDLERQLSIRPDDADLRFQTATTLKNLGHDKASAAMLLAVLRWEPRHQPAHAALAEYYRKIGRDDLADEHRLAAQGNSSGNSSREEAAARSAGGES